MISADSADEADDPVFCQRLALVVSSTGCPAFASRVMELIDCVVPIQGLEMSELTLETTKAGIRDITAMGTAGIACEGCSSHALEQCLLPSILHMNDPLLIQRRLKSNELHSRRSIHQCNLVARNGNLRRVICFYRQASFRAFSLPEMSALKRLSDMLLILLEQHSRHLFRAGTSKAKASSSVDPMDIAFSKRLDRECVPLSLREQEVCVGFLSGKTVPELAVHLQVKSSSVESYLKRATGKLGVRGRHGLARWMASG